MKLVTNGVEPFPGEATLGALLGQAVGGFDQATEARGIALYQSVLYSDEPDDLPRPNSVRPGWQPYRLGEPVEAAVVQADQAHCEGVGPDAMPAAPVALNACEAVPCFAVIERLIGDGNWLRD